MGDVLKKSTCQRAGAQGSGQPILTKYALGYNKDEAMEEAARCLNCKKAKCVEGCPVSINIPDLYMQVKEGNFEKAYQIISESSAPSRQSAAVYVRRRASARVNVSAA